MGESIPVSEGFYDIVKARNRDGETMEETLRRMIRRSDPEDGGGPLTSEEADAVKRAVEDLRGRDSDRLRRARDSFADGSNGDRSRNRRTPMMI